MDHKTLASKPTQVERKSVRLETGTSDKQQRLSSLEQIVIGLRGSTACSTTRVATHQWNNYAFLFQGFKEQRTEGAGQVLSKVTFLVCAWCRETAGASGNICVSNQQKLK